MLGAGMFCNHYLKQFSFSNGGGDIVNKKRPILLINRVGVKEAKKRNFQDVRGTQGWACAGHMVVKDRAWYKCAYSGPGHCIGNRVTDIVHCHDMCHHHFVST